MRRHTTSPVRPAIRSTLNIPFPSVYFLANCGAAGYIFHADVCLTGRYCTVCRLRYGHAGTAACNERGDENEMDIETDDQEDT